MTAALRAARTSAPARPGPSPAALAASTEPVPRPAPVTSLLSMQGISLSFGGVTALSAVDLDVHAGEIRAIIGPNGAGKSSLINVLSGIYKPDRGLIRLGSDVYRHVPSRRLASLGVARTFQNLALFTGLSVLDNIVAGRAASRRACFVEQVVGLGRAQREREEARERAERMLGVLHLGAVRDQLVGTLSYGLQKRVELARALVGEPRLLLLDEPMAGMAAADKAEMAAFIRTARDDLGTTMMLIEHDVGIVMGLSDYVTVLDYGRVIADGTPKTVAADPSVIDAYLGIDPGQDEAA